VQDLATLLWIINLGCIDLNPWYGRCDDVDHPDFVNFDLDPVPGTPFALVRKTALVVREALAEMHMESYVKTSGSRGFHIYIPIVRGPTQKQVWTFAKMLALQLAKKNPKLITSEYRVAKRPLRHVLVDYNQNAWNRTLASVYSVRPTPAATVSTPITWKELADGAETGDFTMKTVPRRLTKIGDLWEPLLSQTKRVDLVTPNELAHP
jgi:bifunctional non-homologous end joining protein LigD